MLADEIRDQPRGVFDRNLRCVDQLVRPLLLNAKPNRLLSAAAKLAEINDNGSIGILYILESPLDESTAFQLPKRILIRNSAGFIAASSRTPPATVDSIF